MQAIEDTCESSGNRFSFVLSLSDAEQFIDFIFLGDFLLHLGGLLLTDFLGLLFDCVLDLAVLIFWLTKLWFLSEQLDLLWWLCLPVYLYLEFIQFSFSLSWATSVWSKTLFSFLNLTLFVFILCNFESLMVVRSYRLVFASVFDWKSVVWFFVNILSFIFCEGKKEVK